MKLLAVAVATFATGFALENAPDIRSALSHYFAGFATALALTLSRMNPRTGETINLPETNWVHFLTSKTLKDALNK